MPSPESASSSPKPKPPRRSKFRLPLGRLLRVYGHSMSPTLNPGELVLVDQGEYDQRQPLRGEIVAARPASFGGRALVKRVAGLPHERVKVGEREWELGDGEFFLLGDRTEHSLDSRMFGPVTQDELIGPVRLRVWPWKRFNSAVSDTFPASKSV